jgi:hypothetical protein
MRERMTAVFEILVLATVLAGGCAKSPGTPSPAAPENASGTAAPASDAPKVVCHLSCSGTEAKGCKPEDGQYFVFCDPPT